MFGFLMAAIALIVQAVRINQIQGEEWRSKGKELYYKPIDIEAERGKILSDDGSPLAISLPFFDIHLDTRARGLTTEFFKKNIDSLSLLLSQHVFKDLSQQSVKKMLVKERDRGNRYLLIVKSADYQLMETIKKFPIFRSGQNKGGIIIDRNDRRERPFKILASRTIGIARNNAPSIGLESKYDNLLKGESGQRLMKKVGPDVYLPVDDVNEIEPKKGKDIVTTINVEIQEAVELALSQAVQTHQAEKACAIVMDVKTGAIKAIANLGYDEQGILNENYNYAIANSTEPGSTMKLASVAAMLEEGNFNIHSTVDQNYGSWTFYDRKMVDSEDHNVTQTDLEYSFIKSSNVGISKLVNQAFGSIEGQKKFASYYQKFGLTAKTSIDLDGEPDPLIKHPVKDKSTWYGTTVPWMSIGYEMQLTPLQVLNFYSSVANGGRLMKPYLLEAILENDIEIKRTKPTIIKDSLFSTNTLTQLHTILRGVVESGTASKVFSDQFNISGKTGTAVTNYYKQEVVGKEYQASFCGFFPSEDPIYSCIVVMYNPAIGFYGAQCAAPVFRVIAERCMRSRTLAGQYINVVPKPVLTSSGMPIGNYGYSKDFEQVFKHIELPYNNHHNEAWVKTTLGNNGIQTQPKTFVRGLIPDLTGMGLRDALFLLDRVGIKVKVTGSGKVIWQSIPPGTLHSNPYELLEISLQ
ncbi:MAG: transpeptidase family protein [Saprospiraceae bacterium]|nr:transpeptidase family protein [Saprospiraceae bacterium]